MKAILDDKGFITSFALEGEIADGIELANPEDIDHFLAHWQSYQAQDAKAHFDEEQDTALAEKTEKETLRQRRQTECFTAESQASATPKLWNTSVGERQPRHFLGRELIRSTTESTNACETAWKLQPFGKKKRSSPLVFSFVPRCHGLCGSAK